MVVSIKSRNPGYTFLKLDYSRRPGDLSKSVKTTIDKTTGIAVKMTARRLIALGEAPRNKAIKTAPATGRKIIAVR